MRQKASERKFPVSELGIHEAGSHMLEMLQSKTDDMSKMVSEYTQREEREQDPTKGYVH